MTSQLDIFHEQPPPEPVARARSSDPWTSHAAARSLDAPKLRATQEAVLALFTEFGEMDHALALQSYDEWRNARLWPMQSPSGFRTRVKELVELGHLRDTGKTVLLPSGRKSIVWAVA